MTYSASGDVVEAKEPLVRDRPATEFIGYTLDRLICFIEEVTAHRLQQAMPTGATITEIALATRAAEAPERFRVTVTPGGLLPWVLTYHQSPFEDI